jgi:hypothetical protein
MICSSVNRLGFMSIPFQVMDSTHFGGNSGAQVTPDMVLNNVWVTLWNAQNELNALFAADWFLPAVRNAWAPGQKLVVALNAITQQTDFQKKLEHMEVYNVTSALAEFETVLRNELAIADVYFVTRKAGFDTPILISNAEVNFAKELGTRVPQAIPDVREAGKCLAFELSTAAGFHVLRGAEAVVRAYWTAVSGAKPHPKQKNLGVYLKKMRDAGLGNAKVLAALQQIKDLHRNPLAHPEETLTLEEAVGLFGIVQSAINAMLKEIPDPPPVPLIGVPGLLSTMLSDYAPPSSGGSLS